MTEEENRVSEKKKKTQTNSEEKRDIRRTISIFTYFYFFFFLKVNLKLQEIILAMIDPQSGIKLGNNKGKKKKSKVFIKLVFPTFL